MSSKFLISVCFSFRSADGGMCTSFKQRTRPAELSDQTGEAQILLWWSDEMGGLMNKQLVTAIVHCTHTGRRAELCTLWQSGSWRRVSDETAPASLWETQDNVALSESSQQSDAMQSTMISGTSLNSANLQMEGLLQLLAKLCDEREVQVGLNVCADPELASAALAYIWYDHDKFVVDFGWIWCFCRQQWQEVWKEGL